MYGKIKLLWAKFEILQKCQLSLKCKKLYPLCINTKHIFNYIPLSSNLQILWVECLSYFKLYFLCCQRKQIFFFNLLISPCIWNFFYYFWQAHFWVSVWIHFHRAWLAVEMKVEGKRINITSFCIICISHRKKL